MLPHMFIKILYKNLNMCNTTGKMKLNSDKVRFNLCMDEYPD